MLASLVVLALTGTRPDRVLAEPDISVLLASLAEQIDQERLHASQPPLLRQEQLDMAAHAHAIDMASNDFLAHTSSDGTDQFERIRRHYPHDTWLGEIIAAGYTSPEAVMNGWRVSPVHRQILLEPTFRAIGLGLAINPAARYRWYWTIDLGGHVDGDHA